MNTKFLKLVTLSALILGTTQAGFAGTCSIPVDEQEAYKDKSQTYINASEDYASYLDKAIRKNWHPSKVKGIFSVPVYFEINKDGTISNLELRGSDAPEVLEKDCLLAITTLAPFKPLPKALGDKYYFEYTFNYKRNWK